MALRYLNKCEHYVVAGSLFTLYVFILKDKYFFIKLLSLSLSIISTKLYLYPRYKKRIKSINKLIKHLNVYRNHSYTRNLCQILQEYLDYKEEKGSSKNWEEKRDLKDRIDYMTNAKSFLDESLTMHMPNKDIPPKNMF